MIKPNCVFPVAIKRGEKAEPVTREAILGILCNPVYTGMGKYPKITEEDVWIKSAMKAVEEIGLEQFFVNMVYVLKMSLETKE